MSEVLSDFIRALRASDVRVSTSESIDAGDVVELVGYNDREVLKDALGQVLAKSEEEKTSFDDVFDRYFAFDQFKDQKGRSSSSEVEAEGGDEGEDGERGQQQGDQEGQGGQSGEAWF